MSDERRQDARDMAEDATRRTRLASERTYLAWWRTGLTALAVSLAAGKVVPELAHTARWPYELLGAGFAVLGVACIAYAYKRQKAVDEALDRGEFAPIDSTASFILTAGGVSLGILTFVLIAVHT
jgi:putative membrane protein